MGCLPILILGFLGMLIGGPVGLIVGVLVGGFMGLGAKRLPAAPTAKAVVGHSPYCGCKRCAR